LHEPAGELGPRLAEVLKRIVERGGKLLIPAFSLGRTQTVLYFLHKLHAAGQFLDVPIYVDSPLAAEATEVFRLHPECFDEETLEILRDHPDLFGGQHIHYVRSVQESKSLNNRAGPMVIIAASGMCEAGRILHHLKNGIEDERNCVLIVGFQAPETVGRKLIEGRPEVRILDQALHPRAEVVALNGFSSHADQSDFDAYLRPLVSVVKKACLVHGEPDRSAALAESLRHMGFPEVVVPAEGDIVEYP
jgi:metallo-beta-lactamase family protein